MLSVSPAPNYTAWRQRQRFAGNLTNVSTQRRMNRVNKKQAHHPVSLPSHLRKGGAGEAIISE